MSQERMESSQQECPPQPSDTAFPGEPKLVPVAESIKYRRRAQQAEDRLQQVEQQLKDAQQQMEQHATEVAQSQTQRDQAVHEAKELRNRLHVQQLMNIAGVVDMEAACTLLAGRVDLGKEIDEQDLADAVESLLTDKPFLRSAAASFPSPTASARVPGANAATRLSQAAQRAAQSGGRKDIASYLRLRRQTASAKSGNPKR